MEKVREMNPTSAGIFIDVSGYTTADWREFDIPVMIPLHSWGILKDIRWIHDWMGKLRIEIQPTYQNLVIAPVIPQSKFNRPSKLMDVIDTYNNAEGAGILADFGFYQLNQDMKNNFTEAADGTITLLADTQKWECTTQTTSEGYIT
jgi:hypothetical protein